MRTILLLATAGCALTGCNQGVSLTNATPEEVARAAGAADAFKLKPGKWQHKVELLGAPVLPAGVPKAVADKMMAATTVTSCLSAEEAQMGPKTFIETPVMKELKCGFAKAEIGGGTISTEMNCTIMGLKTTTRSTGTYSATEYSIDGEQTRAGSDKAQRTRTSGKWLGDCDGSEDSAKAK